MGHGNVRVTPLVGEPIELTGVAAVVWAVLDMPRTANEVFAEALQIDPLLDEADVRAALDGMIESSLVWTNDDERSEGEIAI